MRPAPKKWVIRNPPVIGKDRGQAIGIRLDNIQAEAL